MFRVLLSHLFEFQTVRVVLHTSLSSFSICTARCTIGPLTAYSTFFTVAFIVSMVNTLLLRAVTPFSDILRCMSPRRAAENPDRDLLRENEESGEVIIGESLDFRSPATCWLLRWHMCFFSPWIKTQTLLDGNIVTQIIGLVNATKKQRQSRQSNPGIYGLPVTDGHSKITNRTEPLNSTAEITCIVSQTVDSWQYSLCRRYPNEIRLSPSQNTP